MLQVYPFSEEKAQALYIVAVIAESSPGEEAVSRVLSLQYALQQPYPLQCRNNQP